MMGKVLDKINLSRNWFHYIARPHSLFTASLWASWYTSSELKKFLGLGMPNALLIECPKGSVRYYVIKEEFQAFQEAFNKLFVSSEDKCLELLEKGGILNKEAEKLLKKEVKFASLSEAVDFLIRLALYATIAPYYIDAPAKQSSNPNQKIISFCESLRKVSFYPQIISSIIIPLAQQELKKLGELSDDALDYITFQELMIGNTKDLNQRIKFSKEGKFFIYFAENNSEQVSFETTEPIVQKIENNQISGKQPIKGTTAYPGKVIGKVRLVFSFNGKNVDFGEGEILVAPHTSPALIHLIKKSMAIITDEGGAMCHAAIVSRELKKPCIIGTKIATQVLKDGDMVEVDADNGIVRVIS